MPWAFAGVLAASGCSLTHDLDGLEAEGGAATSSSVASSASSTGGGGGAGGAGGGACTPRKCADVTPACGVLDDGCGGPLDCGCVAPGTCDAATGRCVCPPMPIVTPVLLPQVTDGTHGSGTAWSSVTSIKLKDAVPAHATLAAGARTLNLEASKFGFDTLLPDDAAIQSLSILICRWKSPSTAGLDVFDSSVRLLYAGQVVSQANEPAVSAWAYNGNHCQTLKYDWIPAGQTPPLDTAHAKDPAFGAVLVARAPSTNKASVVANVDWIGMSIAYTEFCLPMNEPLP